METLISKIQQFLSDGKTDKALEVFEKELREKKHPLHSELVILNGEFSNLTKSLRTNLISNEEAQRSKNRINEAILVILGQMDGEKVENPTDEDPTDENPIISSIKSKLKSGLVLGIVGGIVIVIVALFIVLSGVLNDFSDDIIKKPDLVAEADTSESNSTDVSVDTVESIKLRENEPEGSEYEYDPDERVLELVVNELGLKIYNEYKDVYIHGQLIDSSETEIFKVKRATVRKETKQLVRDLNRVEDDSIMLHSKIYKYMGLMVSNKILALTSFRPTDQITYTKRVFRHVDSLDGFITTKIDQIKDVEYQEEMQEWINFEEHENRIFLNKFICMALNLKAEGETKKEDLIVLYNKMEHDDDILKQKGYHIYPIIKWLFSEGIIEHKH